MMTLPNYAAEGRVREVCVIAGVRPECLEDVIARFRDGRFTEATLDEAIAEWKATPGHHFFSPTGADLNAEAVEAFGESRTLAAQADYLKKHGEAAAREMAEKFGTTLGGKPGKTPSDIKPNKPKGGDLKVPPSVGKNPWSAEAYRSAGTILRSFQCSWSLMHLRYSKPKPLVSNLPKNFSITWPSQPI